MCQNLLNCNQLNQSAPKKTNNTKTHKKNPIKKNSLDSRPKNNQRGKDEPKKPNKPKKKFYWGKKINKGPKQ